MPNNQTRMTTHTAKFYGFKTFGSPFMIILLALIAYFGYMSFGDSNFLELFIILIGIYILWPILQVYNMHKKTVTLTTKTILVSYENSRKEDKTIPLNRIESLSVKHSLLGDIFNYQDVVILKKDDRRVFLNGLRDAEMLVNMVKQIETENTMKKLKEQEAEKPLKEEDFDFTNHN
ncbi:MAG: PH domain-containing protein [Bacillota bacterium]